jgi:hypothetical protein
LRKYFHVLQIWENEFSKSEIILENGNISILDNKIMKPLNYKFYLNLLRYGITVREELGQPKETVWLIDWKNPYNNDFAVAEEVTVSGKFTVQSVEDAYFWIATVHLLRSLTKMRFGDDFGAGTPPPICRFSAYGDYQYKNVPVVIQSVKVDLPDNVDYFVIPELTQSFSTIGAGSTVPISSSITVVMLPMYSRRELLGQAQVDDYLQSGNNLRSQGFL